MKAPWFPFYTGDFLASPDVQLMSAAEVGAYTLLLASSWQSDTPGYLPNEEGRLRRICRLSPVEWTESGLLLLSKWPLDETTGLRHNPRLVREASIQLARRERLASNGQKGGRPPKQKDFKAEPTTNLQLSENNLQVSKTEPTGLLSQPQSQSTTVDDDTREASSSDLPTQLLEQPEPVAGRPAAPGQRLAQLTTDPAEEQRWDEGPLTKPQAFRAICERLPHGVGIDCEHYRRLALVAAEDGQVRRTIAQWVSWIAKFLTNQLKSGPLLKPTDGEAARTGVHAPQYAGAYRHEVKPELQAQREAEEAARTAVRIQANYARHAAQVWPATTPAAA